jgi:dinuclear metal center YbgI/SA1388 family protein
LHVAALSDALDAIAPLRDAAEWDNVGLLAGSPAWPARRILLAIDLTDAVVGEALERGVEALLVYHPPILKGIRSVSPRAEAPTTMLAELLAERIAILAVHTALDAAPGGTNDVLLDAFETTSRRPLQPRIERAASYKLAVFVPRASVDALRDALALAGAGVIGRYTKCSFELEGHGTFFGDESTRPAVGRRLALELIDEVRLEMLVPAGRLADVVRALYAVHPYEEPAFDLYPLDALAGRGRVGMGRVGVLSKPTVGARLLRYIGRVVDLSCATVVGDLRRRFRSVTAAAGSFGARQFRDPDSLVLTGELKHHDALELLRRGVTAVCLGHDASERPALRSLGERLRRRVRGLTILFARSDRSPFTPAHRLMQQRGEP